MGDVLDFNTRVSARVNAKLDALRRDIEDTLARIRGPTPEEMRQLDEAEWQEAQDLAENNSRKPRAHTLREWITEAWPSGWRRRKRLWAWNRRMRGR